jgi:metallophosphoesterase (TIGR03767 family)
MENTWGLRRLSRRRLLARAGWLALGTAAWAACGGDKSDDRVTTLDRTLVTDAGNNLVRGPGEPYTVRTELGPAHADRDSKRRSLVVLHHLSDFRITDEESPLRAEWWDECSPPLSPGAFRPQETLSVQAAAALISAANGISESPVTGKRVDFAVHTGNACDNTQFNELRWFIDLMDGKPVYPDSGAIGYQGVHTESPASAYPDLTETAQRSFSPEGLAYPWYTIAGNRDTLVQGELAVDERAKRIAVGAQKVIALGPDALAEACEEASIVGPGTPATILNDSQTRIRGVGSDDNRRPLSLQEWMTEHFGTENVPGPAGHGFSAENVEAEQAYYVFERNGVVFIALHTASPSGSGGSISAEQFAWLEQQLIAHSHRYLDVAGEPVETQNADRLIVIMSHHPVEAMDAAPDAEAGDRFTGSDLEALLLRFPNVVLHICGHTLMNSVQPKRSEGGEGAYWQVTTGSSLEAPMQGRLVDITDNGDGTLSVFCTMYDSLAPINPGDAKDPSPDDGINERLLAGVARELARTDPHADPQAAGTSPSDRNAELILTAPFDTATLPTVPVPDRIPEQ